MYNTEHCEVLYDSRINSVIVKWKKFCKGEEYRKPLLYALDILKNHENCTYITDTTSGFENDVQDNIWLAEEFLPEAIKTTCKKIIFIAGKENELKEELENQAKILRKYFKVYFCVNVDEAEKIIKSKI